MSTDPPNTDRRAVAAAATAAHRRAAEANTAVDQLTAKYDRAKAEVVAVKAALDEARHRAKDTAKAAAAADKALADLDASGKARVVARPAPATGGGVAPGA